MHARTRIAAVVLAAAATAGPAAAQALPHNAADRSGAVIDVPFVPQTPVLCGGAAVAMVLRYWGEAAVRAEDFETLVTPDRAGIRADDLAGAIRDRGWSALTFRASVADLAANAAAGRPAIVLIEASPRTFHYVVVVAVLADRIIMHDPARGPFRSIALADFERTWKPADHWAMLVLPPSPAAKSTTFDRSTLAAGTAASRSEPTTSRSACDRLVAEALASLDSTAQRDEPRRAAESGVREAARLLERAERICPDDANVLAELAGLMFRREEWSAAEEYSSRSLRLRPENDHAIELLAASRYMNDDFDGALRAWNAADRPRNDLTRIEGTRRTRYASIERLIGIPAQSTVTPDALERARRRLRELPSISASRVDYVPIPSGDVQIDAAVVERPALPVAWIDLAGIAAHGIADHELIVGAHSLAGAGESWRLRRRFDSQRPHASLALLAPGAFGLSALWTVRAVAESEAHATAAGRNRDHRTGFGIAAREWWSGSIAVEAGFAADRFETTRERSDYAGMHVAAEMRAPADRAAVRVAANGWLGRAGAAGFGVLAAHAATRSVAGPLEWRGVLGAAHATESTPDIMVPGAGTGRSRSALLRAHPLLDDGVIAGPAFGRTLVNASVEVRHWLWEPGLVRFGIAGFVDAARVVGGGRSVASTADLLLDGGAGLRLSLPGEAGEWRIDFAGALRGAGRAVSVAWQPPWPTW